MIDEIVRTVAVAAIFLAFVLAPLRFLDFSGDRRDDYVTLELHAGALQRLNGLRIANEGAFHGVDAKAVNNTVLDHGMRLVTDAGKKLLAARVRRIHMAVEHQIFPAARATPPANNISASLFHFLPGYV